MSNDADNTPILDPNPPTKDLLSDSDNEAARERGESQVYKLYKYRFVMLFAFTMLLIQNQAMWNLFYNIDDFLAKKFHISYNMVSIGTSVVQNYTALPGTIISSYIFDQISVSAGCITGGLITLLGIWARVYSNESFWYVIVGQTLGGLAQPFFFNTTQKISAIWFGPKERNYSTTAMFVLGFIGPAYSGYVPSFYVDENQSDEEFQERFNKMMWDMAYLATIIMVPCMFLIRSKPPTPPGRREIVKKTFMQDLKTLGKNKNFLLYIFCVGMNQAVSITQNYANSAQFGPYGTGIKQLGFYNLLSVIVAIPAAFLGAYYVTKLSKFKFLTIFLSLALGISTIGFWFVAYLNDPTYIGLYFCIVNFISGPYIPLSLEFVVELTYPVGESTSSGVLNLMPELLGIPVAWGCNKILGDVPTKESSFWSLVYLTVLATVTSLPLFYLKEDLRRLRKNKNLVQEGEEKKSFVKATSVVPSDSIAN